MNRQETLSGGATFHENLFSLVSAITANVVAGGTASVRVVVEIVVAVNVDVIVAPQPQHSPNRRPRTRLWPQPSQTKLLYQRRSILPADNKWEGKVITKSSLDRKFFFFITPYPG